MRTRHHFNGLRGPPVVGAPNATHKGIARGGRMSFNIFIGGGARYTKPKTRRPAGKRKKQQGQR
jgi:hypothetical protein